MADDALDLDVRVRVRVFHELKARRPSGIVRRRRSDEGDAIRERSAGENSVYQAEIEGARSRSRIDRSPSRSLAAELSDLRSRGLRQIGELQRQLSKKSYYYQLLR